jgi:PAS domain S-box-containing protein
MASSDAVLSVRPDKFVWAACAYLIAGGLLSFSGWVFDVRGFTDWFDTAISIQPNTALVATGIGIAILASAFAFHRTSILLVILTTFFSASALLGNFTDLEIGVHDLFLFDREWGSFGTSTPGKMGVPSSIAWTCIGVAVILAATYPDSSSKLTRRIRILASVLSLVSLAIGLLSLIGFIFGAESLYRLPQLTVIAVQTSTFVVTASAACLALLADVGPGRLLMDRGSTGIFVRRTTVGIFIVAIALGWLRLTGERLGLYDQAFGTAARTVAEIAVLLLLLAWAANAAKRAEESDVDEKDRQTLLFSISEMIRTSRDPEELLTQVCAALGKHLSLNRCLFNEIYSDSDHVRITADFSPDDHKLPPEYAISEYSMEAAAEMGQGKTVVNNDSQSDVRTAAYFDQTYGPRGEIAYLAVPMMRDGNWVASVWCSSDKIRTWSKNEIGLVEEVAERTWAAVERLRNEEKLRLSEASLAAELEDARALHDLSTTLFENDSAEKLFDHIVHAAMRLMKSDAASLQIFDPESDSLRLLAYQNLHPESASFWRSVEAGATSPASMAFNSGKRVMADNVETDERFADTADAVEYRRSKLRSMQSTPLLARDGRLIGVISTFWMKNQHTSLINFTLFDVLARQASDAIERDQQLRHVQASEERLKLALYVGELATWDWDIRTGDVIWSNEHYRMQGYEVDEIRASNEAWLARVHPADRDSAKQKLDEAKNGGGFYAHEFRSLLPDGTVKWLWANGQFFYDDNGDAIRMIGVMRDITGSRLIAAALKESEERFRTIANASPAFIWVFNDKGNSIYLNESWYDYTGLDRATGTRGWHDAIHPEDLPRMLSTWQLRKEDGQVFEGEVRTRRHDGEYRWHRFRALPRRNISDEIETWYGVSIDIHESKEAQLELSLAQAALFESERRFRLAQAAGNVGIWDSDLRTGKTYWSDQMWTLYGITDTEQVENPDVDYWSSRIHPEDRGTAIKNFQKALDSSTRQFNDSFRIIMADGEVRWLEDIATIDRDEDGRPIRMYGVNLDVTELRAAKEELQERVKQRTSELATANLRLLTQMETQAELEKERLGLLTRLFTVQEEERGRIARDLHDQLGQRLTALRLKIASLKELAVDQPMIQARVTRLGEITEGIDQEISFLVWELRPAVLDEVNFVPALQQYVTEWSRHYEIFAEFDAVQMDQVKVPTNIENNFYRIAQEALTNTAKYAKAKKVSVLVERRGDQVLLIVEDDGIGFDIDRVLAEQSGKSGFGLVSMRERTALIGGSFEVESTKNEGTTVFVRVPINPSDDDLVATYEESAR